MRRNEPPRGQDSAGARAGVIAARAATVVCGKVALPTVGAGNARVITRATTASRPDNLTVGGPK